MHRLRAKPVGDRRRVRWAATLAAAGLLWSAASAQANGDGPPGGYDLAAICGADRTQP